ncbi:hypothetical protein Nepgr_014714 [Nepenthes gracilis]|uniref:Uncharacterized protein n=1 Tax=Nepenthes gracilis TaxID=150966 RepID=A0AAD3SK06_NEPGR|nr:hypothetical protein Nepgr_014714 [Nepenthes gracilis]
MHSDCAVFGRCPDAGGFKLWLFDAGRRLLMLVPSAGFSFVGRFGLRPYSCWAPLLLPLLVFSAGVGSMDEMQLPFAA